MKIFSYFCILVLATACNVESRSQKKNSSAQNFQNQNAQNCNGSFGSAVGNGASNFNQNQPQNGNNQYSNNQNFQNQGSYNYGLHGTGLKGYQVSNSSVNKIEPHITAYCTGCHGPEGDEPPVFRNFSDIVSMGQSVVASVLNGSMPEGMTVSQDVKNDFGAWRDAGFLADGSLQRQNDNGNGQDDQQTTNPSNQNQVQNQNNYPNVSNNQFYNPQNYSTNCR